MSLHCFKSKIPKKWFFRDYNDISISSKPDVLNRNENKHFHRSQSINSSLPKVSKSHNVITSKMIESQGVFRETIYNPSAIFEKDEEDNEPDNSTTAMFYCHGKQFILIRDSCYIFKKNSKIRYFCLYITESTLFKLFVIVLVILQGVLLGFYDYLDVKSDGFMNQVVDTLEPAFISLYSIECCMKIIARGFYSEQNTYLRKLISFVDLFVVVAAVFSYKDFFRHFGILRFFRILIFCSNLQYFKSLKMLSKLLRNSFWHLVTIIVFLCVFLILFAIVGLNLYKGKLNYRCRLTQSPMEGYWPLNITETRICGGVFKCAVNETCGSNFDYTKTEKNYIIGDGYKDNEIPELNFGVTNFDNILHALIPTCQIYMIEGFQEIIYILFDATNAVLPAIYCMFLILICTFFISNMAIAAMVDNFTKESEKNRGPTILKDVSNSFGTIPFFSPSHTASVGLLGYVVEAKKKIRIFFTKNSIKTQDFPDRWQLYALVLVSNPYFQVIITMFLMVNIVILALDRYPGPSEDDLLVYSYLNIGFTIIFLLECLLKIKGLGMNRYKKDRFNLIELFVAIATTIELVVGSKSTKYFFKIYL